MELLKIQLYCGQEDLMSDMSAQTSAFPYSFLAIPVLGIAVTSHAAGTLPNSTTPTFLTSSNCHTSSTVFTTLQAHS